MIGAVSVATTLFCVNFVAFEKGNMLFPVLWCTGFFVLIFSTAHNLAHALFYLFTKESVLKEADINEVPRCAIVYPVRNEPVGLYERMEYTLQNNNLPGVRLCFLSDSSDEYLKYESDVVKKLRARFGEFKVYYWHREDPRERKQGNIRDWLVCHYKEYKYFMVCDADSTVPAGALYKLLRKAEHPENADIAMFQSKIEIAHAKTIFSRWQKISVGITQKLYTEVTQRVFNCSLSFGHGNLIRISLFFNIEVPSWALSHDIWEMALLSVYGRRTVYCPDVVTYEEVPGNYVEMRARDRRWIKGNLQTYPLLFRKGLSPGARFYIFHGLYIYLSQPVFFCWILLSIFGNSLTFGQFLFFKPIIFYNKYGINIEMAALAGMILGVVFLHKFVIVKDLRDAADILKEIFFSTLICLNNVFYQTLDMLIIFFQKVRWIPMHKDPFEFLSISRAARSLWPSTLLGIGLIAFGINNSTFGTIFALPLLLSFTLSIPVVYLTSLPWPLKLEQS